MCSIEVGSIGDQVYLELSVFFHAQLATLTLASIIVLIYLLQHDTWL